LEAAGGPAGGAACYAAGIRPILAATVLALALAGPAMAQSMLILPAPSAKMAAGELALVG
jgi:hypothetical protein